MCGMCGVGVECEVYAKLEWCVRCMRCVRVWSDVCGECEVGVVVYCVRVWRCVCGLCDVGVVCAVVCVVRCAEVPMLDAARALE